MPKKSSFTAEDHHFIMSHFETMKIKDIAESLNKPLGTVLQYMHRHNIHKSKWTESMDDILIKMYPIHRALEIAQLLGVSLGQVYNRAYNLGLKKHERK